jgi:hypothetical protein
MDCLKMDYGFLAVVTDDMDRVTGGVLFSHFPHSAYRNTLCNILDTLNSKLLAAGKPRIFVRSMDSREKITYDLYKKPMNSRDPDAMLTIFFQMAGDSRVLLLGETLPFDNSAEAQRCMRKAAEHEARVLQESLKKNDARHTYAYKNLAQENAKLKLELEFLQQQPQREPQREASTDTPTLGKRKFEDTVDTLAQLVTTLVERTTPEEPSKALEHSLAQVAKLQRDIERIHREYRTIRAVPDNATPQEEFECKLQFLQDMLTTKTNECDEMRSAWQNAHKLFLEKDRLLVESERAFRQNVNDMERMRERLEAKIAEITVKRNETTGRLRTATTHVNRLINAQNHDFDQRFNELRSVVQSVSRQSYACNWGLSYQLLPPNLRWQR